MDIAALRKLIDDLPTPLAQLAARAINARPGRDRHDAVFYLAEATIKLAAAVRLGRWLDTACDPKSELARRLEAVALPSLGHWCSFFRDAGQALALRDDATVCGAPSATKELTVTPPEWTTVPAFADALVESGIVSADVARKARKQGVTGFFDALVSYRNAVLGHGAQRSAKFYETTADKLLGALAEVLRSPSLFSGMRLAVAQLEVDSRGRDTKSYWRELQGMVPVPLREDAGDARPRELYFRRAGVSVSIHPFVILVDDDQGNARFAFLNRAVEKKSQIHRADYLDYLTSAVIDDVDACEALSAVLTRLRGHRAGAEEVKELAQTLAKASTDEQDASPPAAGATKAEGDDWLGRVIAGKYRVTGLLGAGGMGTVYEAEHLELPRKYAVKAIIPALAGNDELVQRFRREAFAAARLRHPGIVDVVDLGRTDDGTVYMVMEHLDGRSVDELCAEGPLPIARAVTIAIETLDALAVAHESGLVHRDLKPANLFVATDGSGKERVKILDFGIAKMTQAQGDGRLTQSGSVLGTPLFMAPEQIESSADVDARADIYSVGATLFKMLTGAHPASGGSIHLVVAKVAEGTIERDPSAKRPEVPAWLSAVVARALAKLPDDRFASAREMKAALEDRGGASAPRPLRQEGSPSRGRRSLALGVVATMIVGGTAVFAMTRRPSPPGHAVATALDAASSSSVDASVAAPSSSVEAAAGAGPLTADAMFDRYAAAVVLLNVVDASGKKATGTGYIVDTRGTIVTVTHVVARGTTVGVLFRNGTEIDKTEIVHFDEAATLTILRADLAAAKGAVPKLTPLRLRRTDDLGVGERLLSLAYPGGAKDLVLREGVMSSKKPVPEYDWFGATLPVARGEGGGPVLDANGDVVGMIAASSRNVALIAPTSAFRAAVDRETRDSRGSSAPPR